MDPILFRESRETIEQKCYVIEKLIQNKAVKESADALIAAQDLLLKLSTLAQGEVQLRSIANLDSRVKILSENIDNILSKREAGKKGHGNVALKCNWNDKNYMAPCSEEAYKFTTVPTLVE